VYEFARGNTTGKTKKTKKRFGGSPAGRHAFENRSGWKLDGIRNVRNGYGEWYRREEMSHTYSKKFESQDKHLKAFGADEGTAPLKVEKL